MSESTKIALDFEPGKAGSPSTVPPGSYLVSVEEISQARSEKAGDFLKMRFNIEQDEAIDPETGDAITVRGRKLFDNFFTGKKSGFKMDEFMKSIEYVPSETDSDGKPLADYEDWQDETVGVIVKVVPVLDRDTKKETGDFRNEVTKYLRPDAV